MHLKCLPKMGMVACLWFSFSSFPVFADAIEGKKGPAEIIAEAEDDQWRDVNPEQIMVIELERGQVVIELSGHFAQGHVAQIKTLVKSGFYDGLSFYRVIDGFVAQGGDVFEKRELPDGAIKNLAAEFDENWPSDFKLNHITQGPANSGDTSYFKGFKVGSDPGGKKAWLLHCTGAMAMARDTPRNTGGTEFYITLQPQRYLDRNLTVFGTVIEGMQHLQALKRQAAPVVDEQNQEKIETDIELGDKILSAWMGDQPPADKTAPALQVMRTDTQTFANYLEARRQRPEAFFYHRSNHVDICQLPIPIRERTE